ncbi:MAG: DinB family protein [Gemmatimonadetes bacterium]|nr:DinB family protein [Gemmatimonadota bacterium]
MHNYGASQLAASWRTVRKNTLQIAEEIPAEQYGMQVSSETMTVGQMLAHMACATYWVEQAHFVHKLSEISGEQFGAWFGEIGKQSGALTTKEAILAALKANGESYATKLEQMTPAQLDEMVSLPGPSSKSRFEMLLGVKEHEMHHRAQLMQLQRMMGITQHLTRARQAR